MFIYNFKVSGSKIFKIFAIIVSILIIILFGAAIYRIYTNVSREEMVYDSVNTDITSISPKNYTNILKAVHDNLDNYIGQKIKFSGYIYRVYDFNEEQFVLARDMIISSDFQTLVVGFLCNYKDSKNYKDGTWVEITGEITKGHYHGEIPQINILQIQQIEKPNDEYVYPPDNEYIPTSNL